MSLATRRYSVQPRDRIFVKGETWVENTAKNLFDHAKKSVADALKTTSKRVIQKTAEPAGGLIDNKIC